MDKFRNYLKIALAFCKYKGMSHLSTDYHYNRTVLNDLLQIT